MTLKAAVAYRGNMYDSHDIERRTTSPSSRQILTNSAAECASGLPTVAFDASPASVPDEWPMAISVEPMTEILIAMTTRRGNRSPRSRKPRIARKMGLVVARTVELATDVWKSDSIQKAKCRPSATPDVSTSNRSRTRSEEHTSELQ